MVTYEVSWCRYPHCLAVQMMVCVSNPDVRNYHLGSHKAVCTFLTLQSFRNSWCDIWLLVCPLRPHQSESRVQALWLGWGSDGSSNSCQPPWCWQVTSCRTANWHVCARVILHPLRRWIGYMLHHYHRTVQEIWCQEVEWCSAWNHILTLKNKVSYW